MQLPSGEKQEQRYQQAYQKVLRMHRQYPKLAEFEERIAQLLLCEPTTCTKKLEELQAEYHKYLVANKIPLDYNKPKFDCSICQDSGWIEIVDQQASDIYKYPIKTMVKCKCLINAEQQYRLNRLFKISQLPSGMEQQTFKNFKVDVYSDIAYKNGYTHRQIMVHNKEIAKEFVLNVTKTNRKGTATPVRGLYLQGNPGIGKTFLCSAIANALLQHGIPVLYLPFVDFLYQLKDTFDDRNRKMAELIAAAREVKVLILDDLGSENITDFSQEVLFTLLNYRSTNNNLPVVISSNYSIETLKEMYHPRIASRISMQAYILDCVGDDLREIMP